MPGAQQPQTYGNGGIVTSDVNEVGIDSSSAQGGVARRVPGDRTDNSIIEKQHHK